MRLAVATDHRGVALKDALVACLREAGHEVDDLGSHGAASVEKRVWQMHRVMDFPHSGDLWVISAVYEDGTVAALEELVGSHGGVGGEQTDAFVFHPPDMEVPETRNAIDVFHILDRHRGAPVVEKPVATGMSRSPIWTSLEPGTCLVNQVRSASA